MAGWDDISEPAGDGWDAISAPVGGRKRSRRKRGAVEAVTGFMANVNRGLGIGDEMAAGAQTAVNIFAGRTPVQDVGADFERSMAAQRQAEDSFAAPRPKTAALARGAGMATTVAVPAGASANLFAQGSRAMSAARGATVAGLEGAAYAAADRGSAQERLGAASRAARDPATLALGAGAGAIASRGGRKRVKPKGRTVEQLQAAKQSAYKAVEDAGVTYAPQAVDELVRGVTDDALAASINPQRHPRAASMLSDIQSLSGKPITITQLDQLRQVIRRDVASARDPAEAFFGQRMIRALDEFIDAAGPGQVTGGDPERAAQTIRQARDLNTRYRKLETLRGLDEAAEERAASTGTGANIDNVIRQNVRRFKDKTRNLTPEEEAAASRVIRGAPGQNALRAVGRLSPEGGTVSALSSIFTGAASGGAIPAAGFIARRVADALTKRNLAELERLIAGSDEAAVAAQEQLARLAADDPAAAALRRALAERLARASGVAGGARQPTVEVQVEGRPDLYGAAYGPAGNIFRQP